MGPYHEAADERANAPTNLIGRHRRAEIRLYRALSPGGYITR
jgi:hypothetical protein